MTRSICLLLLIKVLLFQNISAEDISVVRITQTTIVDPADLIIDWNPVTVTDQNDPIIGYKVKVWKTPCMTKTIYKRVGEQLMKIIKSQRQKFTKYQDVPQVTPEHVYILKADELTVTVPKIDLEVWYHVRVLAFTRTREGPYSDPDQFKINSDDENDKKKSCEGIISETPVTSTDRRK